jgi:two-component system, OmpR family, phosphate regulon sensor histidine kinase PhoR
MSSRSLWLWAVASAVGVALVLYFSELSFLVAVLGGLSSAAFAAITGFRVRHDAQRRVEAYAAAARGQVPEQPHQPHHLEPARLALEVQSTAASARELSRRLSVLRAVIDGMAEGVWITSDDGTVQEHNNALKEMLYTGRQIVGQRPEALLHSAELQVAVEKACRESQSSRLELAFEGLRPCTLSIHVSPLGRELGGSAAVFFDVTELRRLEKVRKDFVANVSHELRTPITAIRGYAETLQAGALGDPAAAAKMVDIIHRQSERLSELVEDLLELSRLESRQIQLKETPVELADAATRALEAVRPKSSVRNTAIEVLVPEGTFVLGDQRAVEQIILNLLDNAVKYTPSNGRVWVSAQREGEMVVMRVRDDGQGIEPRHLPRLFERFYRVDKGRSRDMGGTGLGLSIVKHLANAMKGDVRVESTPGQGSTFSVTLKVPQPKDFERAAAAPETAEPGEVPSSRSA